MELKDLLADEQFISEILPLDSIEEVQKAFEEKDVELTIEQCEGIGKAIKHIITATDNELEQLSGGGPFTVKSVQEIYNEVYKDYVDAQEEYEGKPVILHYHSGSAFAIGVLVGSVAVGAIYGGYKLATYAGKKVGNWIRDRKTKIREGK